MFVVLAPLDFALQKYLFLKGQRMSKDEVKRENKSQEGDPELKGKRKEIAQELAQESPRRAVARADALIVNPTHYAVAVRYRADEAGVPVVLAKGVDDAALALRGLRRGAERADLRAPAARAHACGAGRPRDTGGALRARRGRAALGRRTGRAA